MGKTFFLKDADNIKGIVWRKARATAYWHG
jgi:hypothetical protein